MSEDAENEIEFSRAEELIMTPEPKLLPCPFCGKEQTIVEFEPHTGAYAEFALPDFQISCCIRMFEKGSHWESGKGTINDSEQAKAKLTKRWNTRTETQRLEERVRELERDNAITGEQLRYVAKSNAKNYDDLKFAHAQISVIVKLAQDNGIRQEDVRLVGESWECKECQAIHRGHLKDIPHDKNCKWFGFYNALTNSPQAAKEMVEKLKSLEQQIIYDNECIECVRNHGYALEEQNERMRKALEIIRADLHYINVDWMRKEGHDEAAKVVESMRELSEQALNPITGQKEKE